MVLEQIAFDVEYSLLGQLAKFVLRPPRLEVVFEFEDASEKRFRAVRPVLGSGVLVNKYFDSAADAAKFFGAEFSSLYQVRSIRLETSNKWGFKPRYSMRSWLSSSQQETG